MNNGFGTIAAIVAGYKAGQISEAVATKLLRQLGADDDVTSLLGLAAGIVGGIVMGDIVMDAVSNIFEDLC